MTTTSGAERSRGAADQRRPRLLVGLRRGSSRPRPRPGCTTTSWPAPASLPTTSGTSATRCSPAAVSFGTPIFMRRRSVSGWRRATVAGVTSARAGQRRLGRVATTAPITAGSPDGGAGAAPGRRRGRGRARCRAGRRATPRRPAPRAAGAWCPAPPDAGRAADAVRRRASRRRSGGVGAVGVGGGLAAGAGSGASGSGSPASAISASPVTQTGVCVCPRRRRPPVARDQRAADRPTVTDRPRGARRPGSRRRRSALHRPRGRLGVGALARLRWEAAVAVLLAAMKATARARTAAARAPGSGASASSTAPVSSTSRASPRWRSRSRRRGPAGASSQPDVRAGAAPPAARSASTAKAVRFICAADRPVARELGARARHRSRPPKRARCSPAARATRIVRSSEPASRWARGALEVGEQRSGRGRRCAAGTPGGGEAERGPARRTASSRRAGRRRRSRRRAFCAPSR